MGDGFMEGAHIHHERLAMLARMAVGGDAIMLLVDPENARILEASPAAEHFYGWSREELQTMTVTDLDPASLHALANLPIPTLPELHVHIGHHSTRSGEIRTVEICARPLEVGEKRFVVATIFDVTELHETMSTLDSMQEHFRKLVELSPDALFVEVEKRFAYVNPAGIELLGARTEEELVGRPILDIIHPDYRDDVDHRMVALQDGFDDSRPAYRKFVRLDGGVVDVEVRAVAIEYDGKPAAQVLVRDIGARVAAEAVLAWNAAIIESSDDAIYSEDVNGVVLNWNRAAERIYGYTADQIVGASVYDTLIPPDLAEDNRERLRQMWLEDRPEHFETRRLHRSGRLIDVAITLSPIHNDDGLVIGISAIGRDVSERKQLEQAKDEFLSLVSHELRTPLTTILGYAQLLAEEHRRFDTEKRVEVAEKVLGRATDMLGLIEELLDATRLQSGEIQFLPVRIDVGQMLSSLGDSYPEAERCRLRLVTDGGLEPLVCDTKWMAIAVGNLISNALKFSPSPEPVVLEVLQGNGRTTFNVHDNGPGIDPARAERLFDRFVQGDMSTTRQHEGAGLGLYIVRRVAEMHGGTATASARPSGGSTFTISIPDGTFESAAPASA